MKDNNRLRDILVNSDFKLMAELDLVIIESDYVTFTFIDDESLIRMRVDAEVDFIEYSLDDNVVHPLDRTNRNTRKAISEVLGCEVFKPISFAFFYDVENYGQFTYWAIFENPDTHTRICVMWYLKNVDFDDRVLERINPRNEREER